MEDAQSLIDSQASIECSSKTQQENYSSEGVVECTYNLIRTDEDCVPVEGSNIHLACPELEAEDVPTSFDVEAYISFSPDNSTANDQSENCCFHQFNGVTQSEWLRIADDLLPNDCGVAEPAQGASAFLPQQQQSPSPPNKEDHSESRCAVTESKAALTDSIVLKKLLRRTRYFDSRKSFLQDRAAVSCTQNRRKVCYLCGQLLHDAKKCPKRRPCYSCKRKGHYAIDCPMNIKESERICLKCGETGHDISSCNNDYCPEDLKKLHCYVCNELGHIFCGNLIDENMPTLSCYNCGESGHSGQQCPKPLLDKNGSRPPSICYKCGEEGHVARRCMKSCEPSKCNEGGQGATLHIRPEIDNGDEHETHKRGRKSFRNGKRRRQRWRDLVDSMPE